METNTTDLEKKYQKLASEYSKVRSQVTVLKGAVLEEQEKNSELKEVIKVCEQKIRKHDQEMDSLNFRNEQLMKRITVLQGELQTNSSHKKNKPKNVGNNINYNLNVFDEELQKKILENAQLTSAMVDKDFEIEENKEKITSLEKEISKLQSELNLSKINFHKEIEKYKKTQEDLLAKTIQNSVQKQGEDKSLNYWQSEAERWKNECELLRSKPESNEQLTKYYEERIREILEAKQVAQSETSTLWAENEALSKRLEDIVIEKTEAEGNLEKHIEELNTTADNYKSQLDAMTEHLASQNEKITRLSDEVQVLRHKISSKSFR